MKPISYLTRSLLILSLAFGLTLSAFPTGDAKAATNQVNLPNVTKTLGGYSGWTTPIVVQNTGTGPTDATLTFYRFKDGTLAATVKAPVLKPGQSWTFDPRSNTQLPDDTQFSVVVAAPTGQVAATVLEGAGSSWMAYAGTATGAATVYLPNITRNLGGPNGWNTPFIVQNIGAAATTASVMFYRFADGVLAKRIDNVSLQPGRSQAFTPSIIDGLADDAQYAVVVQGAAGAQLYAIVNEASGTMAMSYEGLLGGSNVVYMPNILKYLGGTDHWSTPFIVQNLGANATTVNIEFYSFATGALVTSLAGVPIQPGRSVPIDVRFNPPTLPAGSYSVVVRGGPGAVLGAVVNEIDPGSNMAMAYLGIGQSQGQPSAYLPLIQKNTGTAQWFSPIIAQNVGAAAADITLTLFNASGDVAQQRVFTAVKPGAAAVYDPRFDRRLPIGTYSGLVQSTSNVSAVVNMSGTLNGDYAMSFTSSAAPATAVPVFGTTQTKVVGAYQLMLTRTPNTDVWIETAIDPTAAGKLGTAIEADALQVQNDFATLFNTIPTVYMFASATSFAQGLQLIGGFSVDQATATSTKSVGVYVPRVQAVFVNWAGASRYHPMSVTRHELTHAMVDQLTAQKDIPAWLDEGLAFAEELTMPGSKWMDMLSRYGTASMAATKTLYPLVQLESPFVWNTRTGVASEFEYYEGAQLVLMLRADVGQTGILQILSKVGQGRSFADAYATVAGRPFSDFEAQFPDRAKALATTYPGIAAVTDSIVGPGLTFIAYGLKPYTSTTLEVRMGDQASVRTAIPNTYGVLWYYLTGNWTSGTYKITALQGATSVSVTIAATFAATASIDSVAESPEQEALAQLVEHEMVR